MGTLNIQITTDKDVNQFKAADSRPENLQRLIAELKGAVSGAIVNPVQIHTSSSDPVAASGAIDCVYASISAEDTVTIAGIAFTCKGSGATGNQFNKDTNATVTAANFVAAINANATLNKHLLASSALGVVTVTAKQKGSIGNLIVISTSNATGFDITAMANGAGGCEDTATNLR